MGRAILLVALVACHAAPPASSPRASSSGACATTGMRVTLENHTRAHDDLCAAFHDGLAQAQLPRVHDLMLHVELTRWDRDGSRLGCGIGISVEVDSQLVSKAAGAATVDLTNNPTGPHDCLAEVIANVLGTKIGPFLESRASAP